MISSGTLYLFPVYSPLIKDRLSLTQEQTNFVGTAANFGAFFSVFGGMFFDAFGARSTLVLGGLCKFVGYTMMAMTVDGYLPQNYLFAALCGYTFGTGCSTSLTAALGANYGTFKDHTMHGRLVGLLAAFFGLSSGCLSLIYDVFFTDPVSFLYFLALFAGGIDLASSLVVGAPKYLALPTDESDAPPKPILRGPGVGVGAMGRVPQLFGADSVGGGMQTDARLYWGLGICGVTAVHIAASGALVSAVQGTVILPQICLLGFVLLFGFQCYMLLVGTGQLVYRRSDMETVDTKATAAAKAAAEGVGPVALLSLVDFWLLFLSLMVSLGAGVMVINNLAQVVGAFPALGEGVGVISHSLLKLLACTNTLGRLASGALSDHIAARVPRVEFTVYCIGGMALGQFVLSCMTAQAVYTGLFMGVFIVGWFYGALFWAMPTLTMELFGARHFGANRGLVGLSPAMGGYFLSTLLAGKVYAQHADERNNNCSDGGACYRTAFIANAALCVGAAVLCAVLAHRRSRRAAATRRDASI